MADERKTLNKSEALELVGKLEKRLKSGSKRLQTISQQAVADSGLTFGNVAMEGVTVGGFVLAEWMDAMWENGLQIADMDLRPAIGVVGIVGGLAAIGYGYRMGGKWAAAVGRGFLYSYVGNRIRDAVDDGLWSGETGAVRRRRRGPRRHAGEIPDGMRSETAAHQPWTRGPAYR